MLSLIAALALSAQENRAPDDVFGKYIFTSIPGRYTCDKSDEIYISISPKGIVWGDGDFQPLIRLESADRDHYHLWVKDQKTGKAILYGIFIDRNYENAIVISDERAEIQASIDHPGIGDIGLAGYVRCSS